MRIDPRAVLAPLAHDPARAAILLDVDGTLAPIVQRPELAEVPAETRAELERLARRYALVACISGRPGADVARLVDTPGLVYVGEHGFELEPEAQAWAGRLHEFAEGVDWPLERKPLTASFHFREADDPAAALAFLEDVAERARETGLVPRFGRMVLELRPPVAADKGTAVRHLLEARDLRRALYAGDDATDMDAMRELAELEVGIRVAVESPEAPIGLADVADLVVDGPGELLELLRLL